MKSRLEYCYYRGVKVRVKKMGIEWLKCGVKLEITDVKIFRRIGKNLRKKCFFLERGVHTLEGGFLYNHFKKQQIGKVAKNIIIYHKRFFIFLCRYPRV